MKKKLMIVILIFIALNISISYSQNDKPKSSPGISFINEDGEKASLKIKEVTVDVKILGTVAVTTMDILFENELDIVLEGELYFPLSQGQTVSRFAMDINGKLREGVVVEKAKGRIVFEEIVNKRVDPGLLEMTAGNTFKSRVYPIPAKGTKRIVIAYEEVLAEFQYGMNFNLPLNFPNELEIFTIKTIVYNTLKEPTTENNEIPNVKFEKTNDGFALLTKLKNFTANKQFAFTLPSSSEKETVYIEEMKGKTYFMINTFPQAVNLEKTLPSKICIFFDISSSESTRDIAKEIEVLTGYLKEIKNCTVELIPFHIKTEKSEIFEIRNGECTALTEKIKSFRYDGGTQLGAIDINKYTCNEILLFTDGISNFGEKELKVSKTPIIAINSNMSAEHYYLKYIVNSSGGRYINLLVLKTAEAVMAMKESVYSFISASYDNNQISETYPQLSTPIYGRFAFAGMMKSDNAEITLNYGIGKQILYQEKIVLDKSKNITESGLISRLWAQKKLAELDMQFEKNKTQITELGKEYSIVTRNTSLIVLETLDDYLRYKIEPPEEFKEAYFARLKNTFVDKEKDSISHKQTVLKDFSFREFFFSRDYPLPDPTWREKSLNSLSTTFKGLIIFVTDSNDNSINDAWLQLTGKKEGIYRSSQGRISISNLETGNYKLRFYKDGYLDCNSEINISSDSVYTVNVILKKDMINHELINSSIPNTGILKGTVKDIEGKPLIGTTVLIVGTNRGTFVKSSDGSFSITNIIPGSYDLKILFFGFPDKSINVVINPDSTTYVDVIMEEDSNVIYQEIVVTAQREMVNNSTLASERRMSSDEISGSSNYSGGDDPLSPAESSSGGFFSRMFSGGSSSSVDAMSMESVRVAANGEPKSSSLIPTIQLSAYDSDAPYLDDLEDLKGEEFLIEYFKQKEEYGSNPGFFLDVSDMLAKTDKELALKVLSNIAELKLEDSGLLRVLAHRLQQLGYYNLAILMFQDVLKMREEEPQSYRDLGLAYLANKEYQKSADMLFKVVSTRWDTRFPQVELIAIGELNKVIKESKGQVNTENYWKEILVEMPLDVRVVMTWDADQTDIDLWVTDPNDEKCYYQHQLTKIGGLMSKDFTGGLGPEEFLLKKAIPGAYKVEANYYGSRQQSLRGPVVLQLILYTKWATEEETKKEITVRLDGEKEVIEIGEFEFK